MLRSFLVMFFWAWGSQCIYLNFPIDNKNNLQLSAQLLKVLFEDFLSTSESDFRIENRDFADYKNVHVHITASKIDVKNHLNAFKSNLVREGLNEKDFLAALVRELVTLKRNETEQWVLEVKGYTSRKTVIFTIENLTRMVNRPGISIVIPTFNRIAECTASVLMFKARIVAPKDQWEVIVVADGCTDGTGAHLQALFKQKGFENFKVVWTDKEPGKYRNAGWPRNSGAKAASFSHIAFCDSDIYHLSDPITPSLEELALNPDNLIVGNFYCVSGPKSTFNFISKELEIRLFPYQHYSEPGWLLMRRDTYISLGGNSEKLLTWGSEDSDLLRRCTAQGLGIKKRSEIIYLCGNEVIIDHKPNSVQLGDKNNAILESEKTDVRNQDKPDWGKFYSSPPYPEAALDFSKVN